MPAQDRASIRRLKSEHRTTQHDKVTGSAQRRADHILDAIGNPGRDQPRPRLRNQVLVLFSGRHEAQRGEFLARWGSPDEIIAFDWDCERIGLNDRFR